MHKYDCLCNERSRLLHVFCFVDRFNFGNAARHMIGNANFGILLYSSIHGRENAVNQAF